MNFDQKDIMEPDLRVAAIPEGYKWCEECEALTPHKSKNYSWSKECVVCGSSNYSSGCPNCGWSAENVLDQPGEREVILHHEGCHCNWGGGSTGTHAREIAVRFEHDWMRGCPGKWCWSLPKDELEYNIYNRRRNQWIAALNVKCSCPRVTVYPTPNVWGRWSRSYYSQDCINAVEFGCWVRCPICGEVWEDADTNC